MASCIRPYEKKIWQNDKIEVCCRQETLLFIKEECLSSIAFLKSKCEKTNKEQILMITYDVFRTLYWDVKLILSLVDGRDDD